MYITQQVKFQPLCAAASVEGVVARGKEYPSQDCPSPRNNSKKVALASCNTVPAIQSGICFNWKRECPARRVISVGLYFLWVFTEEKRLAGRPGLEPG